MLTKEAKKRREAATAFADAGRAEQAAKETAEGEMLDRYLPEQLSDAEIAELVAGALAAGGFTGKAQMGPAMKAAQAAVAGRAEGGRVAAEVRRQLGRLSTPSDGPRQRRRERAGTRCGCPPVCRCRGQSPAAAGSVARVGRLVTGLGRVARLRRRPCRC